MLAAIAALQLAVLAQIPPSGDTPQGRAASAPEQRVPAEAPAGPRASAPPPQQSLLSAEPLHGGSAALAWAGWSSLGLAYAMGVTDRDDLGAYLDYDWAKSESRLGLLYRRPVGTVGAFDIGARLSLAWYVNLGADYVYDDNHSSHGFEVVPALSLSTRAAGGVFSVLGEAPMTVTTKHENGFLFSPRASVAFEAPLYPSVTVGARVGAGYRAGAGGAPLKEGRGELQFLLLVGYQLL